MKWPKSLVCVAVLCGSVHTQTVHAQEPFLGRTVDQWSGSITSGKEPERVHAAWALAQLAGRSAGTPGEQEQFAEIVKLIHDNNPSVRYWGVMGLAAYGLAKGGEAGGRTAVANALVALLSDQAAAPRIAAAEALGLFGQTEKALPVLVAAMRDSQESVRIQAVAALEKLGPAARPAREILQAAASDTSQYVQRISARALAKLPN